MTIAMSPKLVPAEGTKIQIGTTEITVQDPVYCFIDVHAGGGPTIHVHDEDGKPWTIREDDGKLVGAPRGVQMHAPDSWQPVTLPLSDDKTADGD